MGYNVITFSVIVLLSTQCLVTKTLDAKSVSKNAGRFNFDKQDKYLDKEI